VGRLQGASGDVNDGALGRKLVIEVPPERSLGPSQSERFHVTSQLLTPHVGRRQRLRCISI
jgi:hypothetical protein